MTHRLRRLRPDGRMREGFGPVQVPQVGEGGEMTFAQYWQKLREKNPGLQHENSKLTLSVASLRKTMERCFDAGCKHGMDTKSIFDQIFGDRR